jgi:DNA-directed RNA polymerase subunit RPC12/RpoP
VIAFACSHCGRQFQVNEDFAGRSWPCPTCSQPVTVPGPSIDAAWLLDPSRGPGALAEFGSYRILSVLGKGGMGIVYRAQDPQLQREVAIKMLLPSVAAEPESRQRFLREARATAAIENDHVVAIYQVGEERGIPYLVMPFLKGETLEHWQQRHRPAPVADILRLGREIATGLAAAHARGLIHRDVKPSNIWLEAPSGRVKILDFGLARVVEETGGLTQTGMVAGTPAFMAPEQARAEPLDQRCDLFSLGTVLYGLCTGVLPFQGRTTTAVLTALALDAPPPVAALNPTLPHELADLVMQLLAKKPAERPQSAREVINRLQAIQRPLEIAPAAPVGDAAAALTPPRTERATSDSTVVAAIRPWTAQAPARRRAVILAGLLAGLAATGGALWLINAFSRSSSADGRALPPTGALGTPDYGGRRPVKVFVLAGQSDMGGRAALRTLDWLGEDPQYGWLLSKIKNPDGSWGVRDDVWVYYQREHGLKRGPLTAGFGQSDQEIGPELLFGQVLGDAFDNQVLLIKFILGPLNLAVQGRPPSSGGETGSYYRQLVATVRDVVANIGIYFPDYAGQGCEIAGFVWFHGWNDHLKPEYLGQYETNLVNLIKDVRVDWRVPNLPVVVGEFGIRGRNPSPEGAAIRKVQAATVNRPEFAGNVALVDTAAYWDEQAQALLAKGYDPFKNQWKDEVAHKEYDRMGSQPEYVYMGSGKIMALVGYGFGEAMKRLCAIQTTSSR